MGFPLDFGDGGGIVTEGTSRWSTPPLRATRPSSAEAGWPRHVLRGRRPRPAHDHRKHDQRRHGPRAVLVNGQGGGVTAFSDLTMTNTTVTGDSAENVGVSNQGGGVVATNGATTTAQRHDRRQHDDGGGRPRRRVRGRRHCRRNPADSRAHRHKHDHRGQHPQRVPPPTAAWSTWSPPTTTSPATTAATSTDGPRGGHRSRRSAHWATTAGRPTRSSSPRARRPATRGGRRLRRPISAASAGPTGHVRHRRRGARAAHERSRAGRPA